MKKTLFLALLFAGCLEHGQVPITGPQNSTLASFNVCEMNFTQMMESKFAISCKINLGYSGTLMRANVLMKQGMLKEKLEVLTQANQQLTYSGVIKGEKVYSETPQYQSYGCKFVKTEVGENPQLISPKDLSQINRQLADCALSGLADEEFSTPDSCTPEELAEKINRK